MKISNFVRASLVCLSLGAALIATGCATNKNNGPVTGSGAVRSVNASSASGEKSVLFKSFPGCGIQIWQDEWGQHDLTFGIDYQAGEITVSYIGWWGGAWGAYDNGIENGATFDLHEVAYMTLEAKASTYGTIYFNIDNNNQNELDLKLDWQEYKIPCQNLKRKTPTLFVMGGKYDINEKDTKVYLRNIAWWDENGNEIVPKYN